VTKLRNTFANHGRLSSSVICAWESDSPPASEPWWYTAACARDKNIPPWNEPLPLLDDTIAATRQQIATSTGIATPNAIVTVAEPWWIAVRRYWSLLDGMHRSRASFAEFNAMLEDQNPEVFAIYRRTDVQIVANEPRHPLHNLWGMWHNVRVVNYYAFASRASVSMVANALNATNEEFVERTNLDWFIFTREQIKAYVVYKAAEDAREGKAPPSVSKKGKKGKGKGKAKKVEGSGKEGPSGTHVAQWMIAQHKALRMKVSSTIPCLFACTYVV
jgi:hypothetical protein